MKHTILFILAYTLLALHAKAQENFPINGAPKWQTEQYAFTNATIHVDYETTLQNGTLLIANGLVNEVGTAIEIPKDYVIVDLRGMSIYPSFIELDATYGIPKTPKRKPANKPQMLSNKKGAYGWNQAIRPEINASEHFSVQKKEAKKLRALGFGTALTFLHNGIVRGTSTLVHLGDESDNKMVVASHAGSHFSFNKGNSTQNYPSSLMGTIALLRQTYLDAEWYVEAIKQPSTNVNLSLDAFNKNRDLPQFFETDDKLSLLRASRIAKEFKQQYIYRSSGDEYQRLEQVKAINPKLILPLAFPNAYDVSDLYNARLIPYRHLKHWEYAPSNPYVLAKEGIEFAFTSSDSTKYFRKNLERAIDHGLSRKAALKALTYTPALMVGQQKVLGSLRPGKYANFLVVDGDVFDSKAPILENWVKGKQYTIIDRSIKQWEGKYKLTVRSTSLGELQIQRKKKGLDGYIMLADSQKITIKPKLEGNRISFVAAIADTFWQFTGQSRQNIIAGVAHQGDDKFISFEAVAQPAKNGGKNKIEKEKSKEAIATTEPQIPFPFTAYGWNKKPRLKSTIFRNATVWTNELEGVLTNTDVLIEDGKIINIGKDIPKGISEVIDATGMHLTCGIIDEHSHIAISKGVNEGSQVSSAEVRIGDVINSEDINMYRQLAGGVTTAQLLHGSANPIGGQSAIIKFRWGAAPEQLKMKDATGFMKFALGENVKQSNWGDAWNKRFPQTRMGVEQVFDDYFTRATDYRTGMDSYNALTSFEKSKTTAPRRDLDLEAVAEIINQERYISCHSYVQSEINMLMHMAEKHNFFVNTFTHILEGYKVADKMKAHGAGGSTFSDWWAYKYEVMDAIPYNAALMHEAGVVTAINSDDAEMARRLNQEAAKAVKYGGVSEEEAWKMVTLNPAKLLHIDEYVGSVKVGKSADLVLWNQHPLSVYAKAEMTYIDGICYFNRSENELRSTAMMADRKRIIQQMLKEKMEGKPTQAIVPQGGLHYHCDDIHY